MISPAAAQVPAAGRRRALLALLLVTFLWGFTFIWMKQDLAAAERILGRPSGVTVTAIYLAARFGGAAIVLGLWPRARAGLGRGAWRAGLVIGSLLASGFLLQMVGLAEVSPPVSAFLTSLYVVFAVILTAALHKTRPRASLLVGVLLATLGAGFIEGPPRLTFGRAEWLTVGCAVVFAAHILATDRLTRAHSPLAVTLTSFAWTAALGAIVACAARGISGSPSLVEIVALFSDAGFVVPLVLAIVFATVVALTLMNLFQRELDPVRAAIVYALEPVWTTLTAWALGMGAPSGWLLLGGGALLAGNLVAELGAAKGDGGGQER